MSWIFDIVFLAYFLGMNLAYSTLVALSVVELLRRQAGRLPEFDLLLLSHASAPPVTILAPAYNEEAGIAQSVRAFLQIEYSNLQVIVVNDGSTDGTLASLIERFQLVPHHVVVRLQLPAKAIRAVYKSRLDERLLVIDKENGGKADALNAGLNLCRTPLVCCIDGDTIIDRYALLRMIEPYLYDNGGTVAVGGTIRVANGRQFRDGVLVETQLPGNWLARFQIVEYLRAYLFGRMGFNRLGGNLIISGAFGLFLREAVVAVGGYQHGTVGEDMEIVVRMHRHMRETNTPYRVVFIPDPVAYTEVPETVAMLSRQRDRWQRGLAEVCARHRDLLGNANYGPVGLISMPMYLVFELIGPLVELAGYGWFIWSIATGGFDLPFAVLFFLVAYLWGFMLSLQGIILDSISNSSYMGFKNLSRLVLAALLENVGYRQLTLYFRAKGMVNFLLGVKSWGDMKRQGFAGKPS